MAKFPTDAPLEQVIKALQRLGFRVVRRGNHISMLRENADGSRTPLTFISREEFLKAYEEN